MENKATLSGRLLVQIPIRWVTQIIVIPSSCKKRWCRRTSPTFQVQWPTSFIQKNKTCMSGSIAEGAARDMAKRFVAPPGHMKRGNFLTCRQPNVFKLV